MQLAATCRTRSKSRWTRVRAPAVAGAATPSLRCTRRHREDVVRSKGVARPWLPRPSARCPLGPPGPRDKRFARDAATRSGAPWAPSSARLLWMLPRRWRRQPLARYEPAARRRRARLATLAFALRRTPTSSRCDRTIANSGRRARHASDAHEECDRVTGLVRSWKNAHQINSGPAARPASNPSLGSACGSAVGPEGSGPAAAAVAPDC